MDAIKIAYNGTCGALITPVQNKLNNLLKMEEGKLPEDIQVTVDFAKALLKKPGDQLLDLVKEGKWDTGDWNVRKNKHREVFAGGLNVPIPESIWPLRVTAFPSVAVPVPTPPATPPASAISLRVQPSAAAPVPVPTPPVPPPVPAISPRVQPSAAAPVPVPTPPVMPPVTPPAAAEPGSGSARISEFEKIIREIPERRNNTTFRRFFAAITALFRRTTTDVELAKKEIKVTSRGRGRRRVETLGKRYFGEIENKAEFLRDAFIYIENIRNRDENNKRADEYTKFLFYFCSEFIRSSKGEEKANLTATITASTRDSAQLWEDIEIAKLRDRLTEMRR